LSFYGLQISNAFDPVKGSIGKVHTVPLLGLIQKMGYDGPEHSEVIRFPEPLGLESVLGTSAERPYKAKRVIIQLN